MHRHRHPFFVFVAWGGLLAGGAAPLAAQDAPAKAPENKRLLISSIDAHPDPDTLNTPTIVSYPESTRLVAASTNADPSDAPMQADASGGAPRIVSRPVWTLKDCLDMALRQNADILIAKKGIEGAEGTVITARAAFLPQVSGSALYQHLEQGFAGPADESLRDRDYYVTLRVTENLWDSGADTSRMRIARLAKSTKMLDYQTSVDTVMLRVRLAYYEILLDEANIKVRREAVDLLQKQLKNEQNHEKAGTTSRTSVLRAQVSLANEIPSLLDAQNRRLDAYIRLSQLLNVPYEAGKSEAPFAVTGSLGFEERSYNLADCLSKAVASRPEIKGGANAIETQQKQLVVDRSAVLPRVDAFAGYDITSNSSVSDPNQYDNGYVIGISGTWNIFDGLATVGRMKTTRAKMAAAIAGRDQLRLQVEGEVRQAFNQLDQAAATFESQKQNVLEAKESYVLSQASYDAGLATQLDVLQSRVDLTTAQTTEYQARYDYLAATATLQRSLSGQFQIVNDLLPASESGVETLPSPDQLKKENPNQNQNQAAPGALPAPSFPPGSTPLPPAPSGPGTGSGSLGLPALPAGVPQGRPIDPSVNPTPDSPSPSAPAPPSSVPSPLAPPGAAPSIFGPHAASGARNGDLPPLPQ